LNVPLQNTTKKPSILYLVTTDAYFLSHRLPLARAAQKAGFEIFVAASRTLPKDRITPEGFTFIRLKKLKRTGQNPFQDLQALREIIQIYRDHKPTIVHHVALKPVLYGSLAAWFTGVSRVVNALTGLGYLFISNKWISRLIRSFVLLFFRVLFNRSGFVLVLQNRDDYAKFAKFVKPSNLALIRGSGVDTVHFSPLSDKPVIPAQAGAIKIALVARLLWDKGIGEAVEAIKILKNRGVPVELLLCGNPDPENPRSISEQTVNKWQEDGLVRWLGHVSDVAALYHSVDIALLPSYREGLPKSLLEAASCGLPIVTSNVPGCRELVIEGENGNLTDLTPGSIAEALENLVNNPEQRRTMGLKSREMTVKEFSIERICEETLQVYSLSSSGCTSRA
jgi:glycosyltransferase involved in cell wall biosynthesis